MFLFVDLVLEIFLVEDLAPEMFSVMLFMMFACLSLLSPKLLGEMLKRVFVPGMYPEM